MQIGILEEESFSSDVIKKLLCLGEVSFLNEKEILSFVADKDILFVRLKYFLGKSILDQADKLKYICSPTTALNHIDLIECRKRGVRIISLKGESDFLYNIRATPEHTFGLVLALLRNYKKAFLNPNNCNWDRVPLVGTQLRGKMIGIIGMGRVGKVLVKYFSAFDTSIYFYDRDETICCQKSIRLTKLETLIEKCEIIVLCVSYDIKNSKFFNKKYIDLLENKYFINTSRGEIIDESYLLKFISKGKFKGIALDVISNECGNNNLSQFLDLSERYNLILTPHIAGATYESMLETEAFIFDKLYSELK